MKRFENKELEKICQKAELLQVRGGAQAVVKEHFREMVYDIGRGLAAHDLAVKYGVGERTIWRFLDLLGISFSQLQKLAQEELEIKKKTKLERLALREAALKILPRDISQFKELPIMQELSKQLRIKNVSQDQINRIMKTLYELCQFCEKVPEDITIEDVLNFVDFKKLEWGENGKDLRAQHVLSAFSTTYISPLRVFCAFKGLPIPPALSTTEYYSPYRKVRITVEKRYQLLKWIHDNYPEDYDMVRASLIFLYDTGSRRQALQSVIFHETEEYGVQVVYSITEEKGKKARIRWEKPLNPKWWRYIKGRLPLTDSQVRRLLKILKQAYQEVLEDGLTKMYALKKPTHVWRHTAANDLLEASRYNLMLVAKKLGWKNVQMIVNVYGDIDKAMLLRLSGYEIDVEAAKHEFLHNSWLEKAKKEGLL